MRRVSAQKYEALVNDNGAYIIDPYRYGEHKEWPEIKVRVLSERDYRLMRRTSIRRPCATTWNMEGA